MELLLQDRPDLCEGTRTERWPVDTAIAKNEHVALAPENALEQRQAAASTPAWVAHFRIIADRIAQKWHGVIEQWSHHDLAHLARPARFPLGIEHLHQGGLGLHMVD